MGSKASTPVMATDAADAVIAATARDPNSAADGASADAQKRARQMRRGISSTYSRYAAGASDEARGKSKLGQ